MRSETRREAIQFIKAEIGDDNVCDRIEAKMLVIEHNGLVVVKRDHGFFLAVLEGQVAEMNAYAAA